MIRASKAKRLDENQRWLKLDDIPDLNIAESIFAPKKERTHLDPEALRRLLALSENAGFLLSSKQLLSAEKMMDEILNILP